MLTATIDAHNHGWKHAASHGSRRAGRFRQRDLRHIQRPKIIELHYTQNRLWLVCPSNASTALGGNRECPPRSRDDVTAAYSASRRRRSSRCNVWDRASRLVAFDVEVPSDGGR